MTNQKPIELPQLEQQGGLLRHQLSCLALDNPPSSKIKIQITATDQFLKQIKNSPAYLGVKAKKLLHEFTNYRNLWQMILVLKDKKK